MAPNGTAYLLDRWTGASEFLNETSRELIVREPTTSVDDPAATAIILAKDARHLDDFLTNDHAIRKLLGGMKGSLEIVGWTATGTDASEHKFLVKYSFLWNGAYKCYPFEVDTKAGIARLAAR